MIPKRFRYAMREIWTMQTRLEKRNGRQVFKMMSHPRFRAAYDFLVLRSVSDEKLTDAANWWTELTETSADKQREMVNVIINQHTPKRRRRNRKKRPPENE